MEPEQQALIGRTATRATQTSISQAPGLESRALGLHLNPSHVFPPVLSFRLRLTRHSHHVPRQCGLSREAAGLMVCQAAYDHELFPSPDCSSKDPTTKPCNLFFSRKGFNAALTRRHAMQPQVPPALTSTAKGRTFAEEHDIYALI